MAITKTDYNGLNSKPNSNPKPDKSQTENPATTRKKEQLLKEKDRFNKRIEKKLEQLKMSLADQIRYFAHSIKYAQNPNDDPQGLFNQIDDNLSKMGLKNLADRNQTQLIIGKTNTKKENMYRILLRRQAEINSGIIEKIKREDDTFETMKWNSKGIEVFVWGPYTPPAEEDIPETTI